MGIIDSWLIVSFIAPMLWAIVNVIDAYFVNSVYEDEYDGAAISGVFQLVPWLLVPFGIVTFHYPGSFAAIMAMLGGGSFLLAFFFYFRALFRMNDVSLTQLMWNLSILLVPIFAWLISGERLDPIHYVAIVVAFFGATILAFDENLKQRGLRSLMMPMIPSVIFLSLSMALQDRAFSEAGQNYWGVFLFFSLGSFLLVLAISALDIKKSIARGRHIVELSRKHFAVFVTAEGISVIGTLTSQRAIELAPAVSFVAVVESLLPAFVILISLILSAWFLFTNRELARKLYSEQSEGIAVKIVSIVIIAFAIYLIS